MIRGYRLSAPSESLGRDAQPSGTGPAQAPARPDQAVSAARTVRPAGCLSDTLRRARLHHHDTHPAAPPPRRPAAPPRRAVPHFSHTGPLACEGRPGLSLALGLPPPAAPPPHLLRPPLLTKRPSHQPSRQASVVNNPRIGQKAVREPGTGGTGGGTERARGGAGGSGPGARERGREGGRDSGERERGGQRERERDGGREREGGREGEDNNRKRCGRCAQLG